MSDAALNERNANERNARGEWSPGKPIALAPINTWPPRPAVTFKWLFGFPGYIWPYNGFWLAFAALTWTFLTPNLASMATFELWWVGLLLARNLAFVTVLFGGLHLYFYVFKRQGDELKFTPQPVSNNGRRFRFKNQVHDNIFHTLVFGVPVMTAYEVLTYWGFANGYLGFFDMGGSQIAFWGWFVALLFLAPVIHALHFYFGHRLLHTKLLYKPVHALHHRNVEIGPWSGLSMHPVEHILYFSTVIVQWLLALHPVNALYQIHLAAFLPALSHSGFEKLQVTKSFDLDGGNHFHYLHHKYFECNYGGSLTPLDKAFGTFHDGTEKSHAAMRDRLRARRAALS
ncbi:MAG: sterol desaturase family protein [Alphaproteobacteria bacterium]|jgi:sterol desaturase/sphingolipid hydroxylase (fatty acid hydroxylase superfamily)|nr:sterol desaturase family protein [Alphaproteobacteria bacterium]